jgi:uncharacterized membrane protein YgaE (UPF0421/DUF939 family)
MDVKGRWRVVERGASARLRDAWWPIVLASLAAALAWFVAHTVLGHPQPFFAPIAAAIALSTSQIQRFRRIVQMVVGVLLGIGIGEGLAVLVGTSTVALGAIVLVTLGAAVAAGVGFFGEGMMFANQAAASAILVVTLHRHGTGGERVIDAVVGGAVAFVLGVVMFPAEPLSMLRGAERSVLRTLAAALRSVDGLISGRLEVGDDWALRTGATIHRQLGALARAQSTARANVRIAPRRWRLRAAVDAESSRTTQLELLANAVLGLVRTAATEIHGTTPITRELASQISTLAEAIERLADTTGPWPDDLRAQVQRLTVRTLERPAAPPAERDAVTAAIVRAAADDLARVVVGGSSHGSAAANGRRWHR